MNRSTQVAIEFMIGQMDGLSLLCGDDDLCRDTWSVADVKAYYEQCVEDWPENYDADYYAIWYLDRRSPCVDWQAVADAVQDDRDDLYIACLFE